MRYEDILILGGTGATGRLTVEQALARGHRVTALVRAGRGLPKHERLEVIEGNLLDPDTLAAAVAGKAAVVSCLGISRSNRSSPWAKLLSDPDFMTQAGRALIRAMTAQGVARLVAISVGGAGDSMEQVGAPIRFLFRISKLGQTIRDAEGMEAALAASELDWFAVRPVRLTDGPATGLSRPLPRAGVSAKTPRADLAARLMDRLEGEAPFATRTELFGLA